MYRTLLRHTVALTACLPAVWLALLALLVVRVHFSGSSYAMAKQSPFPFHFTVTQIFFLAFPLFGLGSLLQVVWVRRRFPDARVRLAVALLAVSMFASIAVIALNPG